MCKKRQKGKKGGGLEKETQGARLVSPGPKSPIPQKEGGTHVNPKRGADERDHTNPKGGAPRRKHGPKRAHKHDTTRPPRGPNDGRQKNPGPKGKGMGPREGRGGNGGTYHHATRRGTKKGAT